MIALGSSSSQHDLMVYARLLERRRLLSKLEFYFPLLFLCFLGHAVLQQGSCSLLTHMSLFSSSFFTSAVLLSLYSSRWCNLDCKMFCELNILVPSGAFLCSKKKVGLALLPMLSENKKCDTLACYGFHLWTPLY